jgi:cysteinyl-tRNA synthetase
MHNGFININSEKMSKSLGNIMTISEIRRRHDFEAIRYFLLSSHYRSPIDYTDTAITEASAAVDRFYEMTARLSPPSTPSPPEGDLPAGQAGGLGEVAMEKELLKSLGSAKDKIVAFMDDDFNSAGAFGVLFELIRATNKYLDTLDARPEPARLAEAPAKRVEGRNEWLSIRWKELASTFNLIFGIFGTDPAKYHERRKQIATTSKGVDSSAVENLIADRKEARKAKDFAKADAVKKQLTDMGIELKDRPDGTTEWKVK